MVDPAELLPLVFARPREALKGARAVLAGDPAPLSASIAHQVIGLVERDFGDIGTALVHLRLAVRLARRCGERNREGDALATLGIALIHCGRTGAGLATLRRSIARADGLTAARVRFRLGGALWVLGRHAEALAELRHAMPVLRRAGDTVWTARAHTLRGLIHLAYGRSERADRELRTAEDLFATTEQEHDRAVAVHNRALVAFRAGDLPAALTHLDAAAERYRLLDTPMPELSADRCAVLLAAGLPAEALVEADSAVRLLRSSNGRATRRAELLLAAARAALAADDPATAEERARSAGRLFAAQRRDWWSAHSRLLLLHARFARGAPPAALLPAAERTAHRLAALGSDEATGAYLLAGRIALTLARPRAAERHLRTAAAARHRGPPLARVGGWLAEALWAIAAGRTRRALSACRRGLDVLDAHRLLLGASELRAQASAHGAELAALAQSTCLRTGGARRLLVWSERWRATGLAVPVVHPPSDPALQADFARYRELAGRLDSLRAQGGPAPPPLLVRERLQAERSIRARLFRVRGSAAVGTTRPLDVAGLLAALGGRTLVEIVEIDGRLEVLCADAAGVRRHTAGDAASAAQEVDHARALLRRLAYHATALSAQTVAVLSATGERLQQLLLGPAAGRLGPGPIVLVPPPRLHGVPWALLPALRDSAVDVAPSARAWLRASAVTEPERRSVLVVGGPALATDEVSAVAAAYRRPTVLSDGSATAARVLAELPGRWLAHVAAHGTFRADSPPFSALHLHDGPLTVHDLERLRRAPYRLVLSSCDGGQLARVGADELLGLAATLLPLGTAGIVAAVGPVNDAATVGLMLSLHSGLQRGLSMAAALRDARAAHREDPVGFATGVSFVALGAG